MKVRAAGGNEIYLNPAMITYVRIIHTPWRLFQRSTPTPKIEAVLIYMLASNGNGWGISITEEEYKRILPELEELEWWK